MPSPVVVRRKLLGLASEDRHERICALVVAYAHATGRYFLRGNQVWNASGVPLAHVYGWYALSRRPHVQDDAMDWATRDATDFESFKELMSAARNKNPPVFDVSRDWRLLVMAEHFNKTMMYLADSARALTPNVIFSRDDTILLCGELGWYDARLMVQGEVPQDWTAFVGYRPTNLGFHSMTQWLRRAVRGRFTIMLLDMHFLHQWEREAKAERIKAERSGMVYLQREYSTYRDDVSTIIAFEDERDAVMFRLSVEMSPWGEMATKFRRWSLSDKSRYGIHAEAHRGG